MLQNQKYTNQLNKKFRIKTQNCKLLSGAYSYYLVLQIQGPRDQQMRKR